MDNKDKNKKSACTLTEEEIKERNRGYDHPDSLNNFEATMLYIVAMVVGSIFNDRLIIWVVATAIWFRHISRHWR